MATNWTLYEKKLKINGDTERERHINTVVDSINNDFSHSPSYQEVKINGVTTGVHILEDGNKADNVKNIVMKPSDILSIGNIIEWDGIKWLCTSVELYSGIYYYGKIQKCVYSLTINKNGISSEVPIVIESAVRLYSLGQDRTDYMDVLSDEIIVYAPSSANIEVDDVYKIGKHNYKVMTVQDVLIDGLLVVKMEVTVEEVEEVEEPIEPPATGLFISPTDNFIYRNKTKVFTAKIFNNEVEDTVSRTIWLITNKDGTYNRYCEMTYNNRNCTLTASNESSHVGKIVILRLALESDSSVYIEKEVTIKSLV